MKVPDRVYNSCAFLALLRLSSALSDTVLVPVPIFVPISPTALVSVPIPAPVPVPILRSFVRLHPRSRSRSVLMTVHVPAPDVVCM